MRAKIALAILALLAAAPAGAHRLDEYLQQTTIAVEKARIRVEIVLVPGIAVFPAVLARIDTDGNGVISEAEQRAYAEQVLRDVSLKVDGEHLPLRLVSSSFDKTDALREGRGTIQLDVEADVRGIGRERRLAFENRHQSTIAAYLVNALVPREADIRLGAQDRSFDQSSYRLDYDVVGSGPLSLQPAMWLAAVLMLLLVPALLGRRLSQRRVTLRSTRPTG